LQVILLLTYFNYPIKDFIGAVECTLGSVVGEFGGRLQKPLINSKINKPGTIIGMLIIVWIVS